MKKREKSHMEKIQICKSYNPTLVFTKLDVEFSWGSDTLPMENASGNHRPLRPWL